MSQIKYNQNIETVWDEAPYCNCGQLDCHINTHRLCNICRNPIFYVAFESDISQRSSVVAWNIDYIILISKHGTDKIENLQATHIYCNRKKYDK